MHLVPPCALSPQPLPSVCPPSLDSSGLRMACGGRERTEPLWWAELSVPHSFCTVQGRLQHEGYYVCL